MPTKKKLSKHSLILSAPFLLLSAVLSTAQAGITYQLRQVQASSGESVDIDAIVYNDTGSLMNWTAPQNLVLQWRDNDGNVIRSLAELVNARPRASIPTNNFTAYSWRAVVPNGLTGLQAVNIEGERVMLALDTNPQGQSPITSQPANAAVVNAGAGQNPAIVDPELPYAQAVAAGAQREGPAINSGQGLKPANSSFENFSNAISAHDPTYFIVGNKGGSNARFQLSFKYRLHSPSDPSNPKFYDHFYIGYTQTALWDLHSDSKPFVDTTYRPSFFWRKDSIWESDQKRLFMGLATGYEHASNGKAGDDSRSMNEVFIQPEFNYRFDHGATLTFAPRIKHYVFMGENDDWAHYRGRVDWKLRYAQDNGLVLSGMYNKGAGSRNTHELSIAWPLNRTPLNMNGYLYAQYFSGYAETMLSYRERSSSQFRIGLALVP
ncbi:phospholipase [Alcaligenes faecalis]|uniref:phospholipase A n=1 Tax=Alcaligenes faecalis TaxID=511 RepID=UPI001C9A9056|nr:phospholipase [Alcaligenes faecalis]MBY6317322.1 phospholipase [Alcaligenes faecalis]MBY6391404.1 phospholipase [Alcaligenes faecalis]